MPIAFRILPDHGLVYVRYHGHATVQEGSDAFSTYLAHPAFRPGQRQLVDLSAVSGVEQDFPRLFAFQARKAAALMTGPEPEMFVYLAPTDISLRIARLIQRSWEGLDGAIVRVATDWSGAMDILGLPQALRDEMVLRDA